MNLRMILLAVIIVSVMPFTSYCWMRDADIAHSRDSITLGLGDGMGNYPFIGEKMINKDISVGLFYYPTVLNGKYYKNWTELSYNKQFYGDENSAWAWYVDIVWMEVRSGLYLPELGIDERRWEGRIGPMFGWMYSSKLSEYWKFRFGTLLIMPYRLEWAYKISDNYELSFGISLDGLISVSYIF
jgi:hypothetical protein